MTTLAIDSTSKDASAAIVRDGDLLGEVNLHTGYTHSECLLPAVEYLLRLTKLTVSDIDIFALAAGPGSFTGVRIGAATIKGLAFGRGRVCAPISTLEALAGNLSETDALICPIMDARRGQFYTALFSSQDGRLSRVWDDAAMSSDELFARLSDYTNDINRPIYLVGDGYDLAYEAFSGKLVCLAATPRALRFHLAASAAFIAERRAAENPESLTDDIMLSPSYLRLSQAEREYNEKHDDKIIL